MDDSCSAALHSPDQSDIKKKILQGHILKHLTFDLTYRLGKTLALAN